MKTLIASCLFLVALSSLEAVAAHHIYRSHKAETVSFRIVAIADPIPRSGFSPNRDALLVTLKKKGDQSRPAKIVFRYMDYDDPFPAELIDYSVVHTFKAVRDRSCDETLHSFSTSTTVGKDGGFVVFESVRYTGGGEVPDLSPNDLLPCYVIEAKGYKGSKRLAPQHVELSGLSSARQ